MVMRRLHPGRLRIPFLGSGYSAGPDSYGGHLYNSVGSYAKVLVCMLSYTVTIVESRLLSSLQPTCYLAMYGPGWFRFHIEQTENIKQQKEK